MATVTWDVDTRDWATHSAAKTVQAAILGQSGSIILMHDGGGGGKPTVNAVQCIIDHYRALGCEFVTVDEMLGYTLR